MPKKLIAQDPAQGLLTADALGSALDDLAAYLRARGHRRNTQQAYVVSVRHFIQWLAVQPPVQRELTPETVRAFLERHLPVCRCPKPVRKETKTVRAALNQLLVMRGWERLRPPDPKESPHIEASIRDFDAYLQRVCGLAEATRWYHRRHVRAFLGWLFGDQPLNLAQLTPQALILFVTEKAGNYRPGSVAVLAYSLRTYLRFLQFTGETTATLATALPRPPNWSLATLPPSLNASAMTRFWGAFDRASAIGKRDYAMARCLADLGLRCAEVASMGLESIDWHNGVLRLTKTKTQRVDLLPLPKTTGEALSDYLRYGRPVTTCRALFVHHRAPLGAGVQVTTVRGAMRRAFTRAGLPWSGTHILRHTAATHMLRSGVSFKEIADVLRHRSIDTTFVYTKVDLPNLSRVALPWPGRQS